MSSMETGLTGDDIARDVFAILNGDATADTVDETPAAEVESGAEDTVDETPAPVEDETTGRLRDPATGKFVAREGETQEEADAAGAAEAESGEVPEGELEDGGFVIEVDDEETAEKVANLLAKYDNDPSKALIAFTEAQSLIGRKGNEAREATVELAEVKAQLEALTKGQSALLDRINRPPSIPITQELIENDPATAAKQAVLQDNVEAFHAALAVWQEDNPEAARLFMQTVALEQQLAEQRAVVTEVTPPATTSAALDAEVGKVLERHPDLEKYLPQVAAEAEKRPLLKNAMENGTPAEAAEALEALTIIAKSRTGSDTSTAAIRQIQIQVRKEADSERAKARVVSANRVSADTEAPSGREKFLAEFEARLGINSEE